jgi:hypothetical protein
MRNQSSSKHIEFFACGVQKVAQASSARRTRCPALLHNSHEDSSQLYDSNRNVSMAKSYLSFGRRPSPLCPSQGKAEQALSSNSSTAPEPARPCTCFRCLACLTLFALLARYQDNILLLACLHSRSLINGNFGGGEIKMPCFNVSCHSFSFRTKEIFFQPSPPVCACSRLLPRKSPAQPLMQ